MKTANTHTMKFTKKHQGHYRCTTKGMYITIEQNLCTTDKYWAVTIYKGNDTNYMFNEELFCERYDTKKYCVDVAKYQIEELTNH